MRLWRRPGIRLFFGDQALLDGLGANAFGAHALAVVGDDRDDVVAFLAASAAPGSSPVYRPPCARGRLDTVVDGVTDEVDQGIGRSSIMVLSTSVSSPARTPVRRPCPTGGPDRGRSRVFLEQATDGLHAGFITEVLQIDTSKSSWLTAWSGHARGFGIALAGQDVGPQARQSVLSADRIEHLIGARGIDADWCFPRPLFGPAADGSASQVCRSNAFRKGWRTRAAAGLLAYQRAGPPFRQTVAAAAPARPPGRCPAPRRRVRFAGGQAAAASGLRRRALRLQPAHGTGRIRRPKQGVQGNQNLDLARIGAEPLGQLAEHFADALGGSHDDVHQLGVR